MSETLLDTTSSTFDEIRLFMRDKLAAHPGTPEVGSWPIGDQGVFSYRFTDRHVFFYFRDQDRTFDRNLPHFSCHRENDGPYARLAFSVRSMVTNTEAAKRLAVPAGERHPGIYAAQLLAGTIGYFDRINTPVKYLLDKWLPEDSDNRAQYDAALWQFADLAYPERTQRAAFATWTGQQVVKAGFGSVEVTPASLYNDNTVISLFERSDSV